MNRAEWGRKDPKGAEISRNEPCWRYFIPDTFFPWRVGRRGNMGHRESWASILAHSLMLSSRIFTFSHFSPFSYVPFKMVFGKPSFLLMWSYHDSFLLFYDWQEVFFVVCHNGIFLHWHIYLSFFLSVKFPRDVGDFCSQMLVFR